MGVRIGSSSKLLRQGKVARVFDGIEEGSSAFVVCSIDVCPIAAQQVCHLSSLGVALVCDPHQEGDAVGVCIVQIGPGVDEVLHVDQVSLPDAVP